MLTRRNIILAGEFLALALAFLLGSLALIVIAQVLVCVLILSFAVVHHQLRRLRAERKLPARVFEGDEVVVTIEVVNHSALPAFMVTVEDMFFAARTARRKRVLLPRIPAHGRATATYRAQADGGRGAYDLGPLAVRAADPLGLFPFEGRFECPGRLVVYPRPRALSRLPIMSARSAYFCGAQSSQAMAGHSATFAGAREYRPGDPIRHLHWPSCARHGTLIVKEFEKPCSTDVTVFLDLGARAVLGARGWPGLEESIVAAATIAARAAQDGHAVGLLAKGGQWYALAPGMGHGQLHHVLELLALAQGGGATTMAEILAASLASTGAGSTAVIIFRSRFEDPGKLAAVLGELHARGVHVVAVLIAAGGKAGAPMDAPSPLEEFLSAREIPFCVIARERDWQNAFRTPGSASPEDRFRATSASPAENDH